MKTEDSSFIVDFQSSDNMSFPVKALLVNKAIKIAYVNASQTYNYTFGITLRLVDSEEGRFINKQFKKINQPTNVLAFSGDLEKERALGITPPFLGDIIVCLPVVEKEAKALHKGVSSHFLHMVIHGFLHLLGYDHHTDKEEKQMIQLEKLVLTELGMENGA
jgi:probable rRNA maturation factor|tara:strand:- start:5908 stop:6393 length:486 start_codon:yes stop_codon:yes gene_type:complete